MTEPAPAGEEHDCRSISVGVDRELDSFLLHPPDLLGCPRASQDSFAVHGATAGNLRRGRATRELSIGQPSQDMPGRIKGPCLSTNTACVSTMCQATRPCWRRMAPFHSVQARELVQVCPLPLEQFPPESGIHDLTVCWVEVF